MKLFPGFIPAVVFCAMAAHAPGAAPKKGASRSVEELATVIQTAARGLAFAGRFNSERFSNARSIAIGWLRDLGGHVDRNT